MSDLGCTHIALTVSQLDNSIGFYQRYAQMNVVHQREGVCWLSDGRRKFVIVLLQQDDPVVALKADNHLGFAVKDIKEVDRLCQMARHDGCLQAGPEDAAPPIGYWCYISDPDGHTIEFSYGQDVEAHT